ncbi:FAD binding domain-containing protein, partial [Colletotrichum salicis]
MGLKIIIGGGSVAHLTLANMLERFDGMGYTLLEAYPSIAPQVGGRLLYSSGPVTISERLEEETGYQCVWLDRQMLLQTLYDNLKHKDNVLPNKRVLGVEATESGVTVRTKEGSTYTGDTLVGADGVHSIVREEMWRVGGISRPDIFRQEEDT